MLSNPSDIFILVIAYFLGSIPFGLIIAKCKKVDIRSQGSGNIGATNVTRVIGKKLGAVVLILDGLKGVAAVLIAQCMASAPETTLLSAALVVMGHIFPVWLKFKGGKGVSTTIAVLLALNPLLGGAVIATWLLCFTFSKISSLSALIAMTSAPLWVFLLDETTSFGLHYLCSFLAVLVIACHHENIRRLWGGKEK